jgi:hypothetical protein
MTDIPGASQQTDQQKKEGSDDVSEWERGYLRPCGKRIPENWQDLGRTKAWIFVFGGGKILRSPVSAIRCER